MNDQQKNRIKLALAIGWTRCQMRINLGRAEYWQRPNEQLKGAYQTDIPDPFTDANDCEALIRWLRESGWELGIYFRPNNDYVRLQKGKHAFNSWSGDDWKQGVCELALKVVA